MKLCDPRHVSTETDQSKPSAYASESEPLRQVMFAREIDCSLGALSRRSELAPPVVQNRSEAQGEAEGMNVRQASAKGEPGLRILQGTVGETEEPQGPCRISSAKDPGGLPIV